MFYDILKKLVFSIFFLTTISCHGQKQQNDIIGKWFFSEYYDDPYIIEFTNNKAITRDLFNNKPVEDDYYHKDNKTILIDGQEVNYEIRNKDTIILEHDNEIVLGRRVRDNVSSLINGEYILTDTSPDDIQNSIVKGISLVEIGRAHV